MKTDTSGRQWQLSALARKTTGGGEGWTRTIRGSRRVTPYNQHNIVHSSTFDVEIEYSYLGTVLSFDLTTYKIAKITFM